MTEAIWVAVIMSGLGMVGSAVNGYFIYRADKAKKMGNNPHPCRKHEEMLEKMDDRLDNLEKQIAITERDRRENTRRLDRIETKLNGIR